MKILILAILLCVTIVVPGKPDEARDGHQSNSYVFAISTFGPLKHNAAPTDAQESDDDAPKWYAPVKRPEWWLVIAAFVTVLVVWKQAKEMRRATDEMHSSTKEVKRQADILERQTAATEKAAIAAEKNIGVIISKERAWLTVKPKELNFATIADLAYVAEIAINIDGPTRASVTEAKIGAYIRTVGMIASDIDAFLYPMASIPTVILPNSQIPDQQAVFDKYSGADLSSGTVPEIRDGRLFVEMKGFISYRDAFGNDRVTRFRYVWKRSLFGPAGWEKCGPTEDNQET